MKLSNTVDTCPHVPHVTLLHSVPARCSTVNARRGRKQTSCEQSSVDGESAGKYKQAKKKRGKHTHNQTSDKNTHTHNQTTNEGKKGGKKKGKKRETKRGKYEREAVVVVPPNVCSIIDEKKRGDVSPRALASSDVSLCCCC